MIRPQTQDEFLRPSFNLHSESAALHFQLPFSILNTSAARTMVGSSVQGWLDAIPDCFPHDDTLPCAHTSQTERHSAITSLPPRSKRRRIESPRSPNCQDVLRLNYRDSQQQQLSPPFSQTVSDMDVTPTKKRRRRVDHNNSTELDLTPRAGGATSIVTTSTSTSQSSRSSRSASPRKQIQNLSLDHTGLEICSLDVNSPPSPAAVGLLETLDEIGRGLNILPEQERHSVLQGMTSQEAARWRYSFRSIEQQQQCASLPGWLPFPKLITKVCRRAKNCVDTGQEEAAWNAEVHFRLLESIFRDPETDTADLVDCSTW